MASILSYLIAALIVIKHEKHRLRYVRYKLLIRIQLDMILKSENNIYVERMYCL